MKEKREKKDTRDTKKKFQTVRYHDCRGFGRIKAECSTYKKSLDKAINVTLTDNKSSFDRNENFDSAQCLWYLFLQIRVNKWRRMRKMRIQDNLEKSEHKGDIQQAYDQLFEDNLKLKKLNRFAFKKLYDLKFENERLVIKLGDRLVM